MSAPVSVQDFETARDVLIRIVNNILLRPHEHKFRRLRLTNKMLRGALYPQAWRILHCIGFQKQQDAEWLELTDEFVPMLRAWHDRLSNACLKHSVPKSFGSNAMGRISPAHSMFLSEVIGTCEILRVRSVSRQWRTDAQAAVVQLQLLDLPKLLFELNFHGWFDLTAELTLGDPIAEFHKALMGSPLTCYAGGAMRLKRPVITDITGAGTVAFFRLNPWEMLKVGPCGLREKPSEPSLEWWAKLNALVTTSELYGRQWDWSERSMAGNGLLYARHLIYVIALGTSRVTVTMRAVWDSLK